MSTRPRGRGGRGKALRARGRRPGGGRPAIFGEKAILDEDASAGEQDDEDAQAEASKYSRRDLLSNTSRYDEPITEADTEEDPEIALRAAEEESQLALFLEKQRSQLDKTSSTPNADQAKAPAASSAEQEPDDDVDLELYQLNARRGKSANPRPDHRPEIPWTKELEDMQREKELADTSRDFKSRLKNTGERRKISGHVGEKLRPAKYAAPAENGGMESFLDDLLG